MTPHPTPSSPGHWRARARTAAAVPLLLVLLAAPPAAAFWLARAADPLTTISSAALTVGWLLLVAALVLEVSDLVTSLRQGEAAAQPGSPLRRPLRWLVASAAAALVGLGPAAAAGAAPTDTTPELGPGETASGRPAPGASDLSRDVTPAPHSASGATRPGDQAPDTDRGDGAADESSGSTEAEAADAPDEIDETRITTSDIVVEAGDNFWLLAERELTAMWGRTPTTAEIAGYWHNYVDTNRSRLLPPGEPDLIHPGQTMVVPAPPHDPTVTAPTEGDAAGASNGSVSDSRDGNGSVGTGDSDSGGGDDSDRDADDSGAGDSGDVNQDGGAVGDGGGPDTDATGNDETGGTGGPVSEPPTENTAAADEVEPADDADAPDPDRAVDSRADDTGDAGTDAATNDTDAGADAATNDSESSGSATDDPTPAELGLEGLPPDEELPPEVAAELEDLGLDEPSGQELPVEPAEGLESPGPDEEPDAPPGAGEPEASGGDDDSDGTDDGSTGGDEVAGPSGGRSGTVDGSSASATRPADSDTSEDASESSSASSALLPLGALVLAGALFLLHRRRRAQQRHRERGEHPRPLDDELVEAEHELTSGAAGETALRVEAALLAAAAGAGPTGLPPISWVETGPQATMLVLTSPEPAPEGFTLQDGGWLTTAPTSELSTRGERAVTPAPTLVPIGATRAGSEALIELESSGVVLLDGPADKAESLLRALALGITTSPWNEHGRTVLVAMDGELTDLPGVSQAGLDAALDQAEAHAERTGAALAAQGCMRTAQGRARGAGAEAWQPLVVLSAVRPERPDQLRRLADLAQLSHQGISVVTLAPEDPSTPVSGRRLTIHEDGSMRVDDISELVWPGLVDQAGAGNLVRLLDQATWRGADAFTPATEDGDGRGPVPDDDGDGDGAPPEPTGPPRLGTDQLLEDVTVLIRVLGEVEAVRDPGMPTEQKLVSSRHKTLEAVTYLACRQEPVPVQEVEHALYSNSARPADMLATTMSAVRALVGDDLAPTADENGAYSVPEAVTTDYDLFVELTSRADETDDAHRAAWFLTEALDLVHDEPFAGVGRMYAWVGRHRGVIIAEVVDAAEELAEIRLALGDWRSAEWAARQGLTVFPAEERLYRLLMRIAHASGQGAEGVRRVFEELSEAVADPLHGVEPDDTLHGETIELLAELTGGSPSSAPAHA